MNEFPGFLRDHLPPERINPETIQAFDAGERRFYRLTKDLPALHRGTVFWEGGILHGYPKIKRIIHLGRGVTRHFRSAFYAEEKMDGYNVRIRRIGDELFAFTRGGFVCPFTTDRLPDLVPAAFFDIHPEYTLCGEVVGPDNPYNSEPVPYIEEDVAFFAFDVKDPAGRSLPLHERYRVCEETAVPFTRRWGPFTSGDIEELRRIVFELDSEGREGVVMKSASEAVELKYVTLGSCIRDIEATAHLLAELPPGFYIQRLIRIAAISYEHSLALDDNIRLSLARALTGPLVNAVAQADSGEGIRELFTVRVNSRETLDALMLHLKHAGVNAHLVSVEKDGKMFKGAFYRTFLKGTRELRRKIRGHGFYD